MRWSSLRVTLLGVIERVLRCWLGYVTERLEPAPPRDLSPEREPFESRQPAPPDHWVDLVRQYAPQLLDGDAAPSSDGSGDEYIIEYRAPETPVDLAQTPPPTRPTRPARLLSSQTRSASPPPKAKTSSKRPVRFEQVRTEAVETETLEEHDAEVDGAAVEPPTINTSAGESEPVRSVNTSARPVKAARQTLAQADARPVIPPTRRTDPNVEHVDVPQHATQPGEGAQAQIRTRYRPVEAQPVREVSTAPGASERVAPHFSDLPFAQQAVRETRSSVPNRADVPVMRTQSGHRHRGRTHQRRTSKPPTPSQIVMRPTTIPASLNSEEIRPDRWPLLPDSLSEDVRDTSGERQRRERLIREQEGRAWSE